MSTTCDIDELPDELLLYILGLVRDGASLLDGVSLVSKRWRRLAFEPTLWGRVSVKVPRCLHRHVDYPAEARDAVSEALRTILHAPALLRVNLDSSSSPYITLDLEDEFALFNFIGPTQCEEHRHMKMSAMLRTKAKIRQVRRLDIGEQGTIPVLQKLAPHLEALHMLTMCEEEHFAVLAGMPALRRLDISCAGWEAADGPQSPLPLQLEELKLCAVSVPHLLSVQRMPRLHRLSVHNLGFPEDDDDANLVIPPTPPHHTGLRWLSVSLLSEVTVLSLVRAHAATLEMLEVGAASYKYGNDNYGFFPGLAVGLKGCGLPALRLLALQRFTPSYYEMAHDEPSCQKQLEDLRTHLGAGTVVKCNQCHGRQMVF